MSAVIDRLSPRQGKVLRYLCSTRQQPVTPDRTIRTIEWSDLPKTVLQARKALEVLRRFGLVEKVGKNGYSPTDAGREMIVVADKEKRWQEAPPPEVVNRVARHRSSY
jgi:DNA-binding winged helix-turn-helix (wHTH) protein